MIYIKDMRTVNKVLVVKYEIFLSVTNLIFYGLLDKFAPLYLYLYYFKSEKMNIVLFVLMYAIN